MAAQEPLYTLAREGGLIVVRCFSLHTATGVKALRKDIETVLQVKDKPQDILVILASSERRRRPTIEMVQVAIQTIREVPFRHTAVVGTIPSRIASANLILKAGAQGERMKIFRREEDARAWLAETPLG